MTRTMDMARPKRARANCGAHQFAIDALLRRTPQLPRVMASLTSHDGNNVDRLRRAKDIELTLQGAQSDVPAELPAVGNGATVLSRTDRARVLEHIGDLQTLDDRTGLPDYLHRLCAWLDLREIVVAAGRKTSLSEVAFAGAGYDDRWRALYVRERFILVDPIVRAIVGGRQFVDRNRVINEHNAEASKPPGGTGAYDRFLQLAHDFGRERGGFAGGVVYNRWVALFSAVSARTHGNPCAPLVLFALRPVLCHAVMRLLSPDFRSGVLSTREHAVLEYLANGYGDIQIADALCISVPTVRFHLRNVFEKLGARNRCHAVAIGFQSGLLERWSDLRFPDPVMDKAAPAHLSSI